MNISLSLATLSASTAHELGTPLATLTLLADELRHDQALPAAMPWPICS